MAIPQDTIKILKSERLTDTEDGGGRITGNEVVDGVPNDVFPDIGDIDRATGRVRLRKLFGAVLSQNDDLFVNGNVMLARPPSDPEVHATVFNTNSWDDERSQASNRLESYLAAGPITSLTVLGTQIQGQQAIIAYAREELELPEVGDTVVLSEENLQTGNITAQQFLRVQEITSQLTTFTDQNGDFQRLIVTIETGTPLERDFPGAVEVKRNTVGQSAPTLIRQTRVAAAQRYYGITALASTPALGSFSVQAEDILTQLVPSTTAETALTDQFVAQPVGAAFQIGEPTTEQQSAVQADSGPTQTVYTSRPILPGSLTITLTTPDSAQSLVAEDDGAGGITLQSFGAGASNVTGQIDYAEGEILLSGWTSQVNVFNTLRFDYTPAAVNATIPASDPILIEQNNRGRTYTRTLAISPAPGTLRVSYRALGRWYDLTDNGDGTLSGTPGTGSATFNFATNTILITLGFEPDIGSRVIIQYGTVEELVSVYDVLDGTTPKTTITTAQDIKPGTLSISWNDGTARTATDSGGQLTGDATGEVRYPEGEIDIVFDTMPPPGTSLTIDYEQPNGLEETQAPQNPSLNGDSATFTCPGAPLEPGSVSFAVTFQDEFNGTILTTTIAQQITRDIGVRDNGSGFLSGGQYVSGTINYSTGEVSLSVNAISQLFQGFGPLKQFTTRERAFQLISPTVTLLSVANVRFRAEDPATNTLNDSVAVNSLQIDTVDVEAYDLEPGTLAFDFAGDRYIDRDGTLYRQHDAGTNAVAAAGSVNYALGTITVTDWQTQPPNFQAVAAAGRADDHLLTGFASRANASSLRPGSVQIVATRADGEQLIGESELNGDIGNVAGTMTGFVDYETGYLEAEFYEDDGVTLAETISATIRYNAVAQTNLPIDSNILGLDPVRLPLDGRVPFLQPGYVACLHYTGEDPLPDPFNPNDVHTLPKDRLTWARLKDQNGAYVDTTEYTVDLDAGTITASPTADFSAWVQPLVAEFRIEDIAVVADAELGGQVSLTKPITHEFPVPGSYISSVLVTGDQQARVFGLFDQETWTGQFFDDDEDYGDAVGDAEFNITANPIIVTNQGAVRDRWALVFTNANSFDIIGEITGNVGTGDVLSETAPINPETGAPYFTIPAAGWGNGWAQGNAVRFNTDGANYPFWTALTVMPSDPAPGDIDFKIEFRGNAD